MLNNVLKNFSILKKFLFINFIFFTIIGLFTFIYIKNVQPNLIKKKSSNHIEVINNTIDNLTRLNVKFVEEDIRSFLFSTRFLFQNLDRVIFFDNELNLVGDTDTLDLDPRSFSTRLDTVELEILSEKKTEEIVEQKNIDIGNEYSVSLKDILFNYVGSKNFGSGNKGDLEAVIASILLHAEARTPSLGLDQTYGKLREPLIKFISYARALNIESLNTYSLYPFDNLYVKLAQEPYEYPNVFNFYRPDFQPNGPILDSNLNGPEFQPLTDVTTIGLPNAIHWLINYGIERSTPDTGIGSKWYSQGELNLDTQIAIASDSDDLLNQLDTLITAGRLTPANRSLIKNHIDSMPASNFSQREARVKTAAWLFCLTPEFNSIY